jgi:hypothetical protein
VTQIGTALVATVVLLATGCASTRAGDAPPSDFTGPWAAEFADFDAHADSDFAHRAFADSTISDAEVQEGMSLILGCYDSHGATVEHNAYGYAQVEVMTGSEDLLDVMGMCEFADGGVVVLHGQMRLNPDNLDAPTIQAECLVAAGIAEPGFTAQDLDQAFQSGDLPYPPGDPVGSACMDDPLGLSTLPGATS